VRGLEGPDARGEPRLEGEVVGQSAKQRLAKMYVSLNQTGQNNEPFAINDCGF
jgi:hypothetical protein